MKKLIVGIVSVVACGSLWAGGIEPTAKVIEEKAVEQVVEQVVCFKAGEIQLDVFGAWASSTANNDILENNGWGGGIGVNYFITKYFGIGVEGDYLAVDSGLWGVSGNLIARLPFEGTLCWAPYIFVGGGGLFDGSKAGLFDVGLGIDVRITPRIGLILNGSYNTSFQQEDFVMTRAGLRFSF